MSRFSVLVLGAAVGCNALLGIDEPVRRDAGDAGGGGQSATNSGGTSSEGGSAPVGQPCDSANECASDFCVDSICCESACAGLCETCMADGDKGTCTAYAEGTDPEDECPKFTKCGGASACGLTHLSGNSYGHLDFNQGIGDIVIDSAGKTTVVGSLTGSVAFGDGAALTSAGTDTPDAFIVVLDPDGKHLFSKRYGDVARQDAHAVAVDASDNIVLSGRFEGNIAFGPESLTAVGVDAFVAKLTSSQTLVFQKRLGGSGTVIAEDIGVDSTGDIVVVGYFTAVLEYGSGQLSSKGKKDAFVVKLPASGAAPLWAVSLGGAEDARAKAVAIDAQGDVFVAGRFISAIDLGSGSMVVAGGGKDDLFVAKLDGAKGDTIWGKVFGGTESEDFESIAVDAQSSAYLAGQVFGAVDFGKHSVTPTSMSAAFALKLDSTGEPVSTKGIGITGNHFGYSVGVVPGGMLLAGNSCGSVNLSGLGDGEYNPQTAKGGPCAAFLAKLTPQLEHLHSRFIPAWSSIFPVVSKIRLATSAAGGSAVVVLHSGYTDLGGGMLGNGAYMLQVAVGRYGP